MVNDKPLHDVEENPPFLTTAAMRAGLERMAKHAPKQEEGSNPLQLYEHDIRRFVDAMKYKLRKNAHKGRWEDLDLRATLNLLVDEVEELSEAINEGNMVEIMLEAADIANFAMMVAIIAMEKKQ